ncbi:MAG: hypothetical protein ACO36I_26190, partial [Candidatus Latescibacterota bacterium]
ASLYPETINYVDFYRDGKLVYTSYDDPYSIYFQTNWRQGAVDVSAGDGEWKAFIHLTDGIVIEK